MTSGEFDIIAEYFSRLTMARGEALGLKDDAAVLSVPEGQELVVSTDTLNEGVHFIVGSAPSDIAHKALRANLSDLAAMGAEPYTYQLSIAFPEAPSTDWLEEFTVALLADQEKFGIFCSGGDTTSIMAGISLSLTAIGLVHEGAAVSRAGAKVGDALLLSGPIGDAYLGLQILQGVLRSADDAHFIERYYRPQPRLDLRDAMRSHASAAIDISDGLIADLGHMCSASSLSVVLDFDDVIFSAAAADVLGKGLTTPELLLSGGDDYQLLLAVPQAAISHFPDAQVIGEFVEGQGVSAQTKEGKILDLRHIGWSHF